MRSLPVALVTVGLAACSGRDDVAAREHAPSTSPTVSVSVRLVDSVRYSNELTDGTLRRVEVRAGGRVDTVPGVLTVDTPVLVGDTLVHGLRARENLVEGLFTYDIRARRTRELAAPAEMVPHSSPAVSPDGRHVAFLAQGADGKGYAAVASLPDRRVILRGPPTTMLETDAGVDGVRWTTADSFEIRIDLSYLTGGSQRVRGSVRTAGLTVDTVRGATPTGGDAR